MVKMIKNPNFKIVKVTNEWLPPLWRKSTFPVLNQPAKSLKDITGTAFILSYKMQDFIVTASHVIDVENPVLMFSKKNDQRNYNESLMVSTDDIKQIGSNWIKHPMGFDLAAIPFPQSLQKDLDIFLLTEDKWTFRPFSFKDEIKHLGYPDKGTSNFNGSPWVFPQGMPGNIIQINSQIEFNMKTSGVHGASGGPVFLRTKENRPHLIGVVIETVMLGYVTKALCIWLVKDILDTIVDDNKAITK
jgi:hypothetical protein